MSRLPLPVQGAAVALAGVLADYCGLARLRVPLEQMLTLQVNEGQESTGVPQRALGADLVPVEQREFGFGKQP